MLRGAIWQFGMLWALASSAPAQTTRPAATAPAASLPDAKAGVVEWSSLPDQIRAQMLALLEARDWPIRVMALLRLERFAGDEVDDLIRVCVKDSSWQVRCFALRQAQRRKLSISGEEFKDETEPRVIRAALRFGVGLPDETITELATRLLKTKAVEDLMLGIEIATASDIETIRLDGARRLARVIRNMDDAVAAVIGRRIAAVVDLAPAPHDANAWRQWLAAQKPPLQLAPANSFHHNLAPPPLVAEMENETFTRLLDYMGVLKHRDLELAIVMDATASMIPMVNQARAGVDSLILFLSDISREMRLAFIAYRDRDNPPVCDGHPFTHDIESIRKYLFNLRITGGADYPEAVLEGLSACGELGWKRAAERQIILVGDAPPHPEDVYRVHTLMDSYRDNGFTVHAAHVPMEYPPGYVERLDPIQTVEAKTWLDNYNESTGKTFADIAQAGGGRMTAMRKADELVPAVVHFTVEEAWWPVFDEFYALYVRLCR